MAGDLLPGDVVSVNVPNYGKREGLVIGSHLDTAGREIVEIQFDRPGDYYHAWYPTVTRVHRHYGGRQPVYTVPGRRTVERHVYY